jgi:hypothetical protein
VRSHALFDEGNNGEISPLGLKPMHVAAKLIHFLEPSPEEEYFPFLPVFL